ncbi:hypothetical protein COB52_04285 [Candidatus Kaiserbacteria bacterium]|nr:MAG: hypothetical protein COB52_04285 [Candidatus Kaiserbacteria bacterium]
MDKGKSKEWSEKEILLKKLKEDIIAAPRQTIQNDQFVEVCVKLMKECLEENNITLHLASIDLANVFF